MKEAWKPIPDYEMYEVSNKSRVRRLNRNGGYKIIIPGYWQNAPYLMFSVCSGGIMSKLYLHRCVAQLWVPNPNPKEFNAVCFRDGDKYNVSIQNLYWSNQTQRMKRRLDEGRYIGETNRKLTEEDVIEIREIWNNRNQPGAMSQAKMSKHFNVHPWTIWSVCNYKTWKHVK